MTWQKFPVESVDLEGLSMGSPSSHGVVPASQRLAVAAVLHVVRNGRAAAEGFAPWTMG